MSDPLLELRRALERGEAVVAGCLSGTSADGIDVALTVPAPNAGTPETLAFETRPFPAALRDPLRALLDAEDAPVPLGRLAFLTRELGLAFGDAVRSVAADRGVAIDLVGSHGQTVWHHDGTRAEGRATLQLGDGASLAAAAGATVVSDFRTMDVALGGEGAPLSALVDAELFAGLERPAVVLNLGGMANLTHLTEEGVVAAFDTGPAGSLLDGLARRLLDRPLDANGEAATRGRVGAGLLAELLEHPFFARRPPKSTGRDTFGQPWLEQVVERAFAHGVRRPEDLLATGVALVARSVADACASLTGGPPGRLVLCGGGVHNRALVAALAKETGLPVLDSSEAGVDPDAREALVFALLAARAVLGLPSTRACVTGARRGGVLGAIHRAPLRCEPV